MGWLQNRIKRNNQQFEGRMYIAKAKGEGPRNDYKKSLSSWLDVIVLIFHQNDKTIFWI